MTMSVIVAPEPPVLVWNNWKISCAHTPETIDKIVMNFRKRGLILENLHYDRIDESNAICTIRFEDTELSSNRIYANIQRVYDVISVERL